MITWRGSHWKGRLFLLLTVSRLVSAQPVFTDVVSLKELAARRAQVMAQIGDGVAILLGTTERPGEQPLRQGNQFFYLTGVVEPRAILVIDGRAHKSTLYLNPRIERRETMMFGPGLTPGEPAARATGMDAVLARDEFGTNLSGRTIYAPFRPEVLGSASASDPTNLWKANKADPWDGRSSREEAFIEHLKKASPQSEVKNLDPVLDKMRGTKSASEIALLREATQMTGRAIVEAMRDARPGMYEYELQADAEFVFKKFGAYGPSYFALVATGQNTFYSHYHRGTAKLQDGDLVQFDYAPDYKNYSSDVTRVFPANGKFTAWQAEYYTIYLRLYQALMTSIEVHKTAQQIMKAAVPKMDAIVSSYKFTDPRIKDAATKFVDRYRNSRATSLGHTVGMEVHDVAYPTATLEPGQLFTIEPAMQIPELHLGIRLEDMLMMTDTGYENLSAFVPIEIRDIEKTMHHHGLSDAMAKDKENR